MYSNLKPRLKEIDGQEYELPPLVSWNQLHRRFRVQVRTAGRDKEITFSEHTFGSVQAALDAATVKAVEERQAGLQCAPYKVLGVDSSGKPLRMGEGIYLHSITRKSKDGVTRVYQMLMVIYGTRVRDNLRRRAIALGYAGYFTERRLQHQLQKAKELREQWVREAAPAVVDLTTIWSNRGANLDHRSEAA
jgi:hypothetical protein